MKKYLLLYCGPATPMGEMTEDQTKEANEGWQAWMDRVGEAIVDIGSPLAPGQAVVDDGSAKPAEQVNGYTIIQADDLAAAKKLVENHPFLSENSGKFSIEIFELLPMPM